MSFRGVVSIVAVLLVSAGLAVPAAAQSESGVDAVDPAGDPGLSGATSTGSRHLRVGKSTLVTRGIKRGRGRAYLLVPVKYPLDMSGRLTRLRVFFRSSKGKKVRRGWKGIVTAGLPREGDRRLRFRFVHEVKIGPNQARRIMRGATGIKVRAKAQVDIDGDGNLEMDRATSRIQRRIGPAGVRQCASPVLTPRRGAARKIWIRMPRCGRPVEWKVTSQPEIGRAEIRLNGTRGVYLRDKGRFGADQYEITARFRGRVVNRQMVQVRSNRGATNPFSVSVRAMGDSVTAGFGYYGKTGKQMGITQLLGCKPGATYYNDACSSNSSNRSNSSGPDPNYLPDYGLSRNISWAAQWANRFGITDYKNYAITGSAPTDWLEGGQFSDTFKQIQAENPDFVVMTMGANPLLSDMLFGIDNMGCAIYSDLFGEYKKCIEEAFAGVDLSENLKKIYSELVGNTDSHIVLMQYHLSIPSSALAYSSAQIALMGQLLNEVIAEQAAAVSADRITVISPPWFDVGIDMKPVHEARFSCSYLGYKVDGPSVQSTPTQDELLINHPLSFCSGPAVGPPWVISGDTGIHPSTEGYLQMASQMPPP